MIAVTTSGAARRADRLLIDGWGLPGVALMELAADRVAAAVRRRGSVACERGVLVCCGPGNNGGDGWAVARRLKLWGVSVRVWSVEDPTTDDARLMRQTALSAGVEQAHGWEKAGVVVDALLGTGTSRPVEGALAEAVSAISASDAVVVAVDLPTGVCADTGRSMGTHVRATMTVTLGSYKAGSFTGVGPDACGEIIVGDIGLAMRDVVPPAQLPAPSDIRRLSPRRSATAHKGRSGHLAVWAGSMEMAGAAALVCRGALACGAGKVTLFADADAVARLASLPQEVMIRTDAPTLATLRSFDTVAVGPGLGAGRPLQKERATQLSRVWKELATPAVFDADALVCTSPSGRSDRLLTPHPGEAARLLDRSIDEVEGDRFSAVGELAKRGVCVLKGRHTLIGQRGAPTIVNPTGSPALATAGSGDVLTGAVAALMARGLSARDAAMVGVWCHGKAGESLSGTPTATEIALRLTLP